jgi:hypothetical protein
VSFKYVRSIRFYINAIKIYMWIQDGRTQYEHLELLKKKKKNRE